MRQSRTTSITTRTKTTMEKIFFWYLEALVETFRIAFCLSNRGRIFYEQLLLKRLSPLFLQCFLLMLGLFLNPALFQLIFSSRFEPLFNTRLPPSDLYGVLTIVNASVLFVSSLFLISFLIGLLMNLLVLFIHFFLFHLPQKLRKRVPNGKHGDRG